MKGKLIYRCKLCGEIVYGPATDRIEQEFGRAVASYGQRTHECMTSGQTGLLELIGYQTEEE